MVSTPLRGNPLQDSAADPRPFPAARTGAPKWIRWRTRMATGIALVAVLGVGGWGAVWLIQSRSQGADSRVSSAFVQRGELTVTVVEEGNVESAVNIDIKCEVAGGSSILWIVEDGKQVAEGEKLVELDSSALEEQINSQRIVFEKARAAKVQAEKDYAAAKLAVDEYLQGTFVKALQDQEAQVTIALENLRTAQNTLSHSERMFRKGYISALDLDSQQFSVQRAQLDLDAARTAQKVLEEFTKVKTVQELESARDSAEARVRSESASFDLEQLRLERLEAQLKHCVINAPASGMVVYANEVDRHGRAEQPQVEEGAMVRERQTILQLPDLSRMQVKANVHEAHVEMLNRAWKDATSAGRELHAKVRILDRELVGTLSDIANQPAPPGRWPSNAKEYPTIVVIKGKPDGLRPGMTAQCEILVTKLENVLTIPVTAVVERRGEHHCWVTNDEGYERRSLLLGLANDKLVEVKDGLAEGDQVVLNPRAVIPEAREGQVTNQASSEEPRPKPGEESPGASGEKERTP